MSYIKKNYELSVWEDVWNSTSEEYVEQKLCVIGSHDMPSQAKVFDVQLTRSTNGTKKLSFKLYKKFIDTSTGELVNNPFVEYLVNERKVKLFYRNKWHDFIIKQINESSNNRLYSYSLEDATVIELSKNGFSVVLDEALNNNSGTISELGSQVLADTDWEVTADFTPQLIEESLVYVKSPSGKSISVSRVVDEDTSTRSATLPQETVVLAFYSSCSGKPYRFQFIHLDNLSQLTSDVNKIISNKDCQYFVQTKEEDYELQEKYNLYLPKGWSVVEAYYGGPASETYPVSSVYRGNRFCFSQSSLFHPGLNRYVYEWVDKEGRHAYGYKKTVYSAPILINNLIPNSDNHETKDGWMSTDRKGPVSVEKVYGRFDTQAGTFVHAKDEIFNQGSEASVANYSLFIKVEAPSTETRMSFLSTAPTDNRSGIDLSINNTYVLKGEIYDATGTLCPIRTFGDWSLEEGSTDIDGQYSKASTPFVEFETEVGEDIYFNLTKNEYTAASFKKNSQLKLVCEAKTPGTYYLKDFMLFEEHRNENGELIEPGVVGEDNIVSTKTVYFTMSDSSNTLSTEEKNLVIATMEEPCSPVYYSSAEKIHSVSIKESNYFNILQTLAESFEMWLDLDVVHDSAGRITNKYARFKKYIGKNNYAGFRYGINLKDIQRTEISKNIVTKLVVKDNNNQYANNGFCTIARSSLNESGENTLYNFSYFYKQGLMNEDAYTNYLYNSPTSECRGKDINSAHTAWNAKNFFTRLRNLNSQIDANNAVLVGIQKEILSLTSNKEVLIVKKDSAKDELDSIADKFSLQFSCDIDGASIPENVASSDEAIALKISWNTAGEVYDNSSTELAALETQLGDRQRQAAALKADNQRLVGYKSALNLAFYKKFNRFIREGTWISESHVDDNKYYIDSLSTLRSSCQPIASYSINVSAVDSLPDYESYTYDIGDETFIEDEEFFGTTDRISVVVTELTDNLDDPTKSTIKVQNFKNQFQDLFQKVTATVQQVNYSAGSYEKAAAFVNSDDRTKALFVENALSNADAELWIAGQSTVTQDASGITITDKNDPLNELKLLGGKILISRRDEETGERRWALGLSSQGISANLITTGILNAGTVLIMSGNEPAFRWDAFGLSSYSYDGSSESGKKFVRFDKHGLYGIDNAVGINGFTWHANGLKDIEDVSTFHLTWEGLKIGAEDGASVLLGKQGDWVMMVKDSNGNATFGIAKDGSVQTTGIKIVNGTIDGRPLASTNDINSAIDGMEIGGRNLAKQGVLSNYHSVQGWKYKIDCEGQYMGLKIDSSVFEQEQDYVLSYKFSIDEDSDPVEKIAGHSPAFTTNKAIIDGEIQYGSYSEGFFLDEERTEHEVQIYLTCGQQADKSLYIQFQRTPTDGAYKSKGYIWDLQVEKGNKATAWTPPPEDVTTDIEQTIVLVNNLREDLQGQIDGAITSWFESGTPTRTNKPASDWITADEGKEETPEQVKHEGDLYYDKDTGYCYRWIYDSTEKQHVWIEIQDTDIATALGNAATAQATADGKMKVFSAQPVPPYQVGDLWAQGASGELLRCKTEKAAGENFAQADWEKASKYTDDTKANSVEQALNALKTTSEANFKQYASNFSLIDTSLAGLSGDISGVSSNLTTGLANADKNAQTYANNAKTEAEKTAQGYADKAESNAKTAAQGYANTAESNATTAAQTYADTLVGQMDGSVAQYLGAGGGTLTGTNYVISPYISGGYLNITSTTSRVIIDPHNKTENGWIFQVMSGLTNGVVTSNSKTVIGFDTSGNAYFSGHLTATSGTIGGFNIGGYPTEGAAIEGLWYGTRGAANSFYLIPSGNYSGFSTTIAGRARTDWSLMLGTSFGVTKNGLLFASGVNISGGITATGGSIGAWKIGTVVSASYLNWANSFTNSLWARNQELEYQDTYYLILRPSSAPDNIAIGVKQEVVTGDEINGYSCTVKDIFYIKNNGKLYATEATITGNSTFGGTLEAGTVISDSLTINNGKMLLEVYQNGEAIRICDSARDYYLGVGQDFLYLAGGVKDNDGYTRASTISIGQGAYTLLGADMYLSPGLQGKLFGNWTTAAAVATSSDQKQKHDISMPSENYEEFFEAIRTVRYKYNNGTSNRYHLGFIAQEIEQSLLSSKLTTQDFAGLVIQKEPFVEYYLRYEEFIALNTWQIQKLKPRMTAAEQEILQLKNEIQQLRDEIKNLQKS